MISPPKKFKLKHSRIFLARSQAYFLGHMKEIVLRTEVDSARLTPVIGSIWVLMANLVVLHLMKSVLSCFYETILNFEKFGSLHLRCRGSRCSTNSGIPRARGFPRALGQSQFGRPHSARSWQHGSEDLRVRGSVPTKVCNCAVPPDNLRNVVSFSRTSDILNLIYGIYIHIT